MPGAQEPWYGLVPGSGRLKESSEWKKRRISNSIVCSVMTLHDTDTLKADGNEAQALKDICRLLNMCCSLCVNTHVTLFM